MTRKLHHVGVLTTDIEKSKKEYTGHLGLMTTETIHCKSIGRRIAFCNSNGIETSIELIEGSEAVMDHLAFLSENLVQEISWLNKQNMEFDGPVEIPELGIKAVFYRNESGIKIELFERLASQ